MPTKALGLDDFHANFYQNFWSIMGPGVIQAFLGVLNKKKSVGAVNGTNIVLILKKKNLDRVADYRPISLCSVI